MEFDDEIDLLMSRLVNLLNVTNMVTHDKISSFSL